MNTELSAEMDIVVQAGRHSLGIDVKFSSAPRVTKGSWNARDDLKLAHTVIVAPVERRFPTKEGAEVIPVNAIGELLIQLI